LTLGGWAKSGTETKPWFWDGKASVPGGTADGNIQALSLDKGQSLVVKHQTPPWFTFEDGKTSVTLDGLNEDDRVVAVAAGAVAK
jgi:hypothetical protein